jgi:hypothetical protein
MERKREKRLGFSPLFSGVEGGFFFSSEKQKIGEGICCNYVLHLSSFYARI